MRCKNCGWENEAGSLKCEKCNAPLKGSMIDSDYEYRNKTEEDDTSSLTDTISEKKAFGSHSNEEDSKQGHFHADLGTRKCSKCGYQISPSMMVCPACGTHMDQNIESNEEKERTSKSTKKCPSCGNDIIPGTRFCAYCGKPFRMGTINAGPAVTPGTFFTLQTLPWENERVQYQPMSFCGESVVLNRANTDPNNNSITSSVQAVLTNENGEWYIEDKSDLHSTYLRVKGKVELHDGDVIVLGNRMFEFRG